jgi:carboxypeptidase Taq
VEKKIEELKTYLHEVADIEAAIGLLGWDQETYMPRGAVRGRGLQLATLGKIAHIKSTSPRIGELLDELSVELSNMDPESNEACLIRETSRLYQKHLKVPAEWVETHANETANAQQVWAKAREGNDFSTFEPYLKRIIDLKHEYAEFFEPYDHPYDPLLDDYEPGLKTTEVVAIFESLRPKQVDLIQKILNSDPVDDSFLHQPFARQKQWDFGVDVITRLGFDWEHGRLDKSAHPFTENFGIDDIRLTTRVNPDYIGSALFGTMHEAGHGMYEAGVDHALERTPLAGGTSLAIHESQSRMYENLVGRSRPFWEFYYPRLKEVFPAQFEGIELTTFYKGINRVKPSLIRVEADEATYNLHIMLRLDLEIALIEGKLEVKDLPQAWNERMQQFLGIVPENDSVGVLQDIHWSMGLFGYFSTYALGNLVSLQLWKKINQDIPGLEDQIRQGEFLPLLDWLRQNVHRHGSKHPPQDLVQRITGSTIDAGPYIEYLNVKYGEIYNL